MTFKAIVIDKTDNGQQVRVQSLDDADLMDGDVTVRVTHSTLNYKDGLAISGKAPVVRRFPMIPGIDFAGVVEVSSDPGFKPGDSVLLNGWGVGETHLGGLAERTRVPGAWLVPIPAGLNAQQAMAVGTAGYTAMLCVMALERHGLSPDRGPVVVTGATGGVGSIATTLLAASGWHVIASTGHVDERDYLLSLGAAEIIDRSELAGATRPLSKERWIAGVDVVGSQTLANMLSMTRYGGAVTACGLAGGMDLPSTVAPFILRGVSLLGIDSVMAPSALRTEAWSRLAGELDLVKLASMVTTVGLGDAIDAGRALIDGHMRGRVVVEIGSASSA